MLSYLNQNYDSRRGCVSSFSWHTLLSLFVFFPFRATVQVRAWWRQRGERRGSCGWERSCCWEGVNTQSAGISSFLTPFARCPSVGTRLCLSSGNEVAERSRSKAWLVLWWRWLLACLEEVSEEAQGQARLRAHNAAVKHGHLSPAALPRWLGVTGVGGTLRFLPLYVLLFAFVLPCAAWQLGCTNETWAAFREQQQKYKRRPVCHYRASSLAGGWVGKEREGGWRVATAPIVIHVHAGSRAEIMSCSMNLLK